MHTTGVRTCWSTGCCLNVLNTNNVNKNTDITIASNPNTTPQLNHIFMKCGLHCPILTNVLLNMAVYHLTWQIETDRPVLSNLAM